MTVIEPSDSYLACPFVCNLYMYLQFVNEQNMNTSFSYFNKGLQCEQYLVNSVYVCKTITINFYCK